MTAKSLLTLFLVLSSVAAGNAQDAAVSTAPKNMVGLWAVGGKCDDPASTLTIAANSVQFGSDAPQAVSFSDDAAPEGDYGALMFKAKGAVGNVEYQDDRDLIVSHPKGFGKGAATTYSRCIDASNPAQNRCGWIANLTPGDWWLIDKDATWTLTAQLQHMTDAAGMNKVPDFIAKEFTPTNGDPTGYGYGCGCLDVVVDAADKSIVAVLAGKMKPLAVCKADKTLPAYPNW